MLARIRRPARRAAAALPRHARLSTMARLILINVRCDRPLSQWCCHMMRELAHADPLSRSTMQRDAPTVRFYDSRGNVTGSASTYGNTTKFYAPDGKLVGSATNNGSARPLRQKGELSSSAISTLTKCRRSEE